jgi:ribonucleoside-diphosphate reductase beta chain
MKMTQDNKPKILQENKDRFVIFPIKHYDIWDYYKRQTAAFWTAEELDLETDVKDWREKLNDNERYFIKHILAFFAASDGIVNENLAVNFYNEVQYPEARNFYASQIFIEGIHGEVYSLFIDTYIEEENEKQQLYQALENIDSVQKKGNWAIKWIESENFIERLIAFAVVEGIFFSGSFCSIFWMKQRGLLPGLAQANELISRDEGLHASFACMLYNNHIEDEFKLPKSRIHEIVSEAVEIEKEFISESLPVNLIGMNAKLMKQYIEFVTDRLLDDLNLEPMFGSKNPFDFMENIGLEGKTNFFERRVTEYKVFDPDNATGKNSESEEEGMVEDF